MLLIIWILLIHKNFTKNKIWRKRKKNDRKEEKKTFFYHFFRVELLQKKYIIDMIKENENYENLKGKGNENDRI